MQRSMSEKCEIDLTRTTHNKHIRLQDQVSACVEVVAVTRLLESSIVIYAASVQSATSQCQGPKMNFATEFLLRETRDFA